jgi:hypothetical protein
VEVGQACGAIDVFRLTRNRCNPAIHGLANLADHKHAVCTRAPQGLKNSLERRMWERLTRKKNHPKTAPRVGLVTVLLAAGMMSQREGLIHGFKKITPL